MSVIALYSCHLLLLLLELYYNRSTIIIKKQLTYSLAKKYFKFILLSILK